MKTKLCIAAGILLSAYGLGQNAIGGHAKINTSMNNYQVQLSSGDDDFWDWTHNITNTFIPRYSRTSPIFASSMWIGGYDQNNILHTAASTYRQNGFDFWL